jgi:hypothetical protein
MLGAISPAAGNVTLYGADGRPRLTFEPDGADRKGELTP